MEKVTINVTIETTKDIAKKIAATLYEPDALIQGAEVVCISGRAKNQLQPVGQEASEEGE